jgi:ACT domain-containing protein
MQDLCSIKLMKAIITVVGSDQKGIIARVSAILAENNINIADISQTILSGNFVMMMMVELQESKISIDELRSKMEELGSQMDVNISIMNEKVFSAMHRIYVSLFKRKAWLIFQDHAFFCVKNDCKSKNLQFCLFSNFRFLQHQKLF